MQATGTHGLLERLLADEATRTHPLAVSPWIQQLKSMPGVVAVLFYGSGLRKSEPDSDGIHDFYILVERYRDFSPSWPMAAAGSLIPPNVYFYEHEWGSESFRGKAAVMTLSQFCAEANEKALTPHIWARFCQPCRILYARDAAIQDQIIQVLVRCVLVFHRRTLHLVEACSIPEFWRTGLHSTYEDEIRSDTANRTGSLFFADPQAFTARTRAALPLLPDMGWLDTHESVHSGIPLRKRRAFCRWNHLLRPLKKAVVVLRLAKAAFSFGNSIAYAQWKIERHSGVRFPISDFQKRHPLIGGFLLACQAIRRQALR